MTVSLFGGGGKFPGNPMILRPYYHPRAGRGASIICVKLIQK
jgi:hypothetical protein